MRVGSQDRGTVRERERKGLINREGKKTEESTRKDTRYRIACRLCSTVACELGRGPGVSQVFCKTLGCKEREKRETG